MADPGDIIPGQKLEEAAAEVTTDAGKSLVRGIARVLSAKTAEWVARKEAKADAAREAIETEAQLECANAITDARRAAELSEIEHQKRLALAKRRAERMIVEMAREQDNLESVIQQSLNLIESEPGDSEASVLDEDWLFRFARYAEQVSDKDLHQIWARVLRSASVKGKQKLSAAALLQLSLIDKAAALDFEKFCKVFKTFGMFPAHERYYDRNALDIEMRSLEELGLVQHAQPTSLQLNDVRFEIGMQAPALALKLFHMSFVFTNLGAEIANAIFGQEPLTLSDAEEDAHLQEIIADMMRGYETILVVPRGGNYYVVVHRPGAVEPLPEGALQELFDKGNISIRLMRLLNWVVGNFSITIHLAPNAVAS